MHGYRGARIRMIIMHGYRGARIRKTLLCMDIEEQE